MLRPCVDTICGMLEEKNSPHITELILTTVVFTAGCIIFCKLGSAVEQVETQDKDIELEMSITLSYFLPLWENSSNTIFILALHFYFAANRGLFSTHSCACV